MGILIKIKRFLFNPIIRVSYLSKLGFYDNMPTEKYLKMLYKVRTGEELDLDFPRSYNEKLQWLKVNYYDPEYAKMADKYLAKKYVAEKIGEEYIIPTLGVWESPDEIDFDALPDKFVLKCTHNSGTGMTICTDKSSLDIKKVKKELKKGLGEVYWLRSREWSYKGIKPRIICEKYMVDESGKELKDYKIFCFNGVPRLIQVDFNRFVRHTRNIYTPDWELMDAEIKFPSDKNVTIPKPVCLDKLLELASVLSAGMPHVRTDFYIINDKIYFGELTFFHGGGFEKFTPKSLEMQLGDWLILPEKKQAQ